VTNKGTIQADTSDVVNNRNNGGITRVKQFCADHVAKVDYLPGCPAQVR